MEQAVWYISYINDLFSHFKMLYAAENPGFETNK